MKIRYLFLLYSPLIKGVTTKFPLNKGGLRGLFLSTAFCLLLTVFLWGCGGETGGGGAVFETVTLTASADPAKNPLYSDVAKHTKKNTDAEFCTSTDFIAIEPDSVDVTIKSEVIPDLPEFVKTSRVRLDKVTISYSPATNPPPPALPNQYYTLNTYVDPDGSATVPVEVVSHAMKGSSTLNVLACDPAATIYSYYATLRFEGVEVNTDKRESFEATLTIHFSDFVDK